MIKPRRWQIVAALAALAIGAALWSGVWRINQNEQGVVLRFGQALRVVPPGIHFTLPWPFETLARVAVTEVRSMPVGFRLTDQVRNIAPLAEDTQWLSGDTNIVELQVMVLYTIRDPEAYLFGVSDFAGGRHRDFLIRKVTEAVLTEHVAATAIDEVLAGGKTRLQTKAGHAVQTALDELGLGVQISALNVIAADPPAAVIGAFNDVSSARADRARRINEARGYAMQLLPKARAEANRIVQEGDIYRTETMQRARGEARSFTKMLMQVNKQTYLARRRLWIDAVERMLSQGRKIVFEPAADGSAFRLYLQE